MIKIYIKNLKENKEENNLGKWLELPASDEEITEALKEIHINGESKEYFISDLKCDVTGININKDLTIYELNDIANELCDMNEEEIKICSTIMKNENCTLYAAIEQKNNRQVIDLNKNESNTEINLAYSYIEQLCDGDIVKVGRENIEKYFDFEGFGRDLKMNFNIDDDETIAVSNT